MNAQQLKNSILQEAISGKLVPQDPNDEPASVLLNRIREEKKRLVKEGKLKKKDLEETPISEDDIPFDIPDSWEWVRLGEVSSLIGGFAFKSHEYTPTGSRVIRISDISEDGFINKTIVRYPYNEKLQQYRIYKGDILMAMTGGTVGKSLYVKVLPEESMLLNQRVAIIRVNSLVIDYIDYVVKSQHIQSIITDSKNSTNDNISMVDIYNFPIPLPPLAEQKRIVEKIEELLPKVEEYGKAQESLDKLNEELPDRLKKSILQEAIEGRLVPQDPNDEPASVLLDKIRAEKKRLVKEGKLKKKDLEETPISEDEIPFKIPEGWVWTHAKDCCKMIFSGKSPSYSKTPTNHLIIGQQANQWNGIDLNYVKYGTDDFVKSIDEYQYLIDGDVLLNTLGNGTLGRCGIFENIKDRVLTDGHLFIFRTIDKVTSKYILYYLTLNYIAINKGADGSTNQTFLNLKKVSNYIVPLPPLAEQKRIVEKIEQLFHEIDKLKVG